MPQTEFLEGSELLTLEGISGAAKDLASQAMAKYAAGDESAFDVLYELLNARLFGFLLRRTHDRERTADLLQQTFLHIHRARRAFVSGNRVVPWALAIARRLVIDSVRRARRDLLLGEAWEGVTATTYQVDDPIEARELASRFEGELARLPEPQRMAFELKQRGLSLSESAEALRISTGAVKMRLNRANLALRTALFADEKLP